MSPCLVVVLNAHNELCAIQKGRAVQVDPMKFTLTASGTKRLKLEYATLLSSFAFKINLRRFRKEAAARWRPGR